MGVIYHRPPRGRPIYLGMRLGLWDVQGAFPRFWCPSCGTEVFSVGAKQCPRCEKEEKKYAYEELSQPLWGLYPGE